MNLNSNNAADDLDEHVRPNVSRIERYRNEVARARKKRWPYERIAAHLKESYGLVVSDRAVSAFCRRRGIKKGVGETMGEPTHSKKPRVPAPGGLTNLLPKFRKKKVFTPRDGPVATRMNGELDDS